MNLVLLQNPEELDLFRTRLGTLFHSAKIIAWTPFAVDALRQEGIEFSTASDLEDGIADPQKLINQFRKFQAWCEILDGHAGSYIPHLRTFNVRPFLNKLQALRVKFFLLFHVIDQLRVLIDKLGGTKVYYFHYPGFQLSLLSRVLDVISDNRNPWGVEFVSLQPHGTIKTVFPKYGLVPDWFSSQVALRKIIKHVVRKSRYKSTASFLSGFSGQSFFKGARPNVLVTAVAWDVGPALEKLIERFACNLVFWEDVCVPKMKLELSTQEIVRRISNDPEAHVWTTYGGIDLFDLFITGIEKTLERDVPRLIATVKKFRRLHRRFNFKLVVSTYGLTQTEAIFDQCEDLNVPVAFFSEGAGSHGPPLERYPILPVCYRGRKKPSKFYYFVNTDEMLRYNEEIKSAFPNYTANNVVVGSNYYETLMNKGLEIGRAGN